MKSKNTAFMHVVALTSVLLSGTAIADGHANLPSAIEVPAGNKVAMSTSAVGTVAWLCKQGDKGIAWSFAGPAAVLSNDMGKPAVSYYGPPATWEAIDGSKVTGKQLATAPAGAGNIPFQLVKADESERDGHLKGVTYIQRINLNGGAAPVSGCDADNLDKKVLVAYTGNYIFWKSE